MKNLPNFDEFLNESSVFADFSTEQKRAWKRAENRIGKTFFVPSDETEYKNLMSFLADKEWFFWNVNAIAGFPANEPINADSLPKWKKGLSFELGGSVTGSKFVIPIELKANQEGGSFDYVEFAKTI
jgi:hypothetical protein